MGDTIKCNEILDVFLRRIFSDIHESSIEVFWETNKVYRDHNHVTCIKSARELSIYDGNAGILLTLCLVYQTEPTPRLKEVIRKSLNWIQKQLSTINLTTNSFFTGYTGIIYTLLYACSVLNDRKLQKSLIDYARTQQGRLNQLSSCSDMINGNAGTGLGLLMLRQFIDEDYVEILLKTYSEAIVESAELAYGGACWDRTWENSRNLCGYSHGSSGIGYFMFLMSVVTGNKTYREFYALACDYENKQYSTIFHNWPDFRLDISQPITESRHYRHFENRFFSNMQTQMKDSVLWCHGAPGIGMERLVVASIDSGQQRNNDIEVARIKVAQEHTNNLSLCHGLSGNTLFLFHSEKDRVAKIKIAEVYCGTIKSALKDHRLKSGLVLPPLVNDHSLFLGDCGIIYTVLSFMQTEIINILCPLPQLKMLRHQGFGLKSLQRMIIRNLFLKSQSILQKINKLTELELIELVRSKNLNNQLSEDDTELLRINEALFNFRELHKISNVYLYIKELYGQSINHTIRQRGEWRYGIYPDVIFFESKLSFKTFLLESDLNYYVVSWLYNKFEIVSVRPSVYKLLKQMKENQQFSNESEMNTTVLNDYWEILERKNICFIQLCIA